MVIQYFLFIWYPGKNPYVCVKSPTISGSHFTLIASASPASFNPNFSFFIFISTAYHFPFLCRSTALSGDVSQRYSGTVPYCFLHIQKFPDDSLFHPLIISICFRNSLKSNIISPLLITHFFYDFYYLISFLLRASSINYRIISICHNIIYPIYAYFKKSPTLLQFFFIFFPFLKF